MCRERCGDPFDASIGGVHVCVFSLNSSDDTVSKLFVCCCCAAHLQGRRFALGFFWSVVVVVVVDVFFVFCLKVSLMKLHVLNPWS